MFINQGNNVAENIDVMEAEAFIKENSPLILDVRSKEEYDGGHLFNSHNTPLPGLDNFIPGFSEFKERPVLVYCHSGMRSARAAQILMQNGFTKVYNLKQGFSLWAAKGLKYSK